MLKKLKKQLLLLYITIAVSASIVIIIFIPKTLSLISRPKRAKKNIPQKNTLATKSSQIDTLLNRIRSKHSGINFLYYDNQFILDDDGFFKNIEKITITSVPVPKSLEGITGLDKSFTYEDRIKATDALGNYLTEIEQRALLYFLHKHVNKDSLKPIELNAVKNQVATLLMRQIPANQEFPMHLIAMYYEEDNLDLVWRDYCIQFLGQCYGQIDTNENKQIAKKTLFTALKDNKNIAAPAIIAIDGLSKYPEFIHADIANEAYKLAYDNETANIVKIPALQIAAKYKHPKAVNLARKILLPSSTSLLNSKSKILNSYSVLLKMSAIATIGNYGNRNDIDLLNKYRKSADIRLRTASKVAIKKLL